MQGLKVQAISPPFHMVTLSDLDYPILIQWCKHALWHVCNALRLAQGSCTDPGADLDCTFNVSLKCRNAFHCKATAATTPAVCLSLVFDSILNDCWKKRNVCVVSQYDWPSTHRKSLSFLIISFFLRSHPSKNIGFQC